MDRAEALAAVQKVVAEVLAIEPSLAVESASPREDLEADSLDLIEIAAAVEDNVGVRIPDEPIHGFDATGLPYRSVIDSLGIALPAGTMTTQEALDGCVRPPELPLEESSGILSRRVCGDNEYSIDLATRAAVDCFARSSITPHDVDLLINASLSRVDGPDRFTFEPAAATRLRRRLRCRNAWTFDVANACAGVFTAIYLADTFIRFGCIQTALVISGEFISHILRTAQLEIDGALDPRVACLTLGDAGIAVLLTRTDDQSVGFEHIALRTIGIYHNLCVAGPTGAPHGGIIMRTDTLGLARAGVRETVAHLKSTLDDLGYSLVDVDRFIPHQTSSLAIRAAISRANRAYNGVFLHPGNVVDNLAERGNTSTTTHLVALHDASVDGRIRSGQRVLFAVSGSGLNVGTAVYSLDDLPDRIAHNRRSARTPSKGRTRREAMYDRPVRVRGRGTAGPFPWLSATTLELARQAVDQCLARAGRRPSDVELLIHAGVYRSGMIGEPATAAALAGEIGFDGSTASSGSMLGFDLTNGGMGLFDACRVASTLIRSGQAANALVVTSEVEERNPADRAQAVATCGSAQYLEADPEGREGYLGFAARHVDPPGPVGAARHVGAQGVDFAAWGWQPGGGTFVASDDRRGLAEQFVAHIPQVAGGLLAELGAEPDAIRVVVPPWLPPSSLKRLKRSWPVLGRRLVEPAWGDVDLFTSSLSFGLDSLLDNGIVTPGDLVLFVCAASGIEIGMCLYQF